MSLGGKTTETQSIDPDLKAAALANLQMAQRVGQLGFTPYKGATVAGMQPAQIGAMQNLNTGLEAFGFSGSPIPAAGDLSPYGIYQQQLAQMAPGQRAFIESMFINPVTGAAPTMQFGYQPPAPMAPTAPAAPAAPAAPVERGGGGAERAAAMAEAARAAGGGNRSTTSLATPASYLPGGVNTRNPGSLANRVVAAMTPAQGAPTAANRPVARAVATTNPSKATQESMAKAAAANAASRPVTVAASGGGSGSMSTAAANAAAANKAAEAKAAAERQARDRIAAAERDRAAANKAASEKAKQDAAKGKGGKSGPSNSGSKSSGGSAGRR
jgi:hypothetical protein